MKIEAPTAVIGESHSNENAGRRALLLFAASCCFACQPTVTVGQLTCPPSTVDANTADASTADADATTQDASAQDASMHDASAAELSVTPVSDPIVIPWFTGFENRFCDFRPPAGFCFGAEFVQDNVVTTPVKFGHYAAAFSVIGVDGGSQQQSRCARAGVLPSEAYYGAWYYIPANAINHGLWNLFHFQGYDPVKAEFHGLWDVSLSSGPNGLSLLVLNFLWKNSSEHILTAPTPVPIASWFHIEFYLKRAKDATGEAALYYNGVEIADFKNLTTDDTDLGQWYAGNLATSLSPPESTLYLDNVTIARELGWTPPP